MLQLRVDERKTDCHSIQRTTFATRNTLLDVIRKRESLTGACPAGRTLPIHLTARNGDVNQPWPFGRTSQAPLGVQVS